MKVIVPCCGSSSRFPGQPPKWTLPAHDGRPMLAMALSGLECSFDDLVVTILREHENKYGITRGLEQAFGRPVKVVMLDERTASQSETVARTLAQLDRDEPCLIKDSDGYFKLDNLEQPHNYVCVDSLNHFDAINPRNKSYVQVDVDDVITAIREKVVISDLFNVGGYYFSTPGRFLETFERLHRDKSTGSGELYLSNVIGAMMAEGVPFRARRTSGFQDWGTVREWRRALLAVKTFYVLLDGFVFERGSQFFSPRFEDVAPQARAVDAVRSLAEQGHKVVYLSIRPPALAALTQKQLEAAGLPAAQVVWNCPIAQWILVTSPHPTLPILTSRSVEIAADDAHLMESIDPERAIQ